MYSLCDRSRGQAIAGNRASIVRSSSEAGEGSWRVFGQCPLFLGRQLVHESPEREQEQFLHLPLPLQRQHTGMMRDSGRSTTLDSGFVDRDSAIFSHHRDPLSTVDFSFIRLSYSENCKEEQ